MQAIAKGWRLGCGALLLALAGCGGNLAAEADPDGPRTGPDRKFDRDTPGLFGPDGLTIGSLREGIERGGTAGATGGVPVNRFLWQATLETLAFLPLSSTDPFTGVIATDWGSTVEAPGERFKVTAFMTSPALVASSLNVAVYREVRNEEGVWLPAAVDPDTASKLEDAILTRARQIRIADANGVSTG